MDINKVQLTNRKIFNYKVLFCYLLKKNSIILVIVWFQILRNFIKETKLFILILKHLVLGTGIKISPPIELIAFIF
jgi:hypothetical protein